MRILVVDDEPAFRQMFSEWLSRQGYDVQALDDESDVLKALEQRRFDLVTLDLFMPKANGLALISHIRHHHPNTNVMVISGETDVRIAIAATKAGAEACMAKPMDFEFLRRELKRLKRASETESAAPGLSLCVQMSKQ